MFSVEHGVMHGYLSATVKGHSQTRSTFWRNRGHGTPGNSGEPNVAGWKQLANLFGKGGGEVIVGGERLVN